MLSRLFVLWICGWITYRKSIIDQDKRELQLIQEMYLQDGDLHTDGAGRERKFRWRNIGKCWYNVFSELWPLCVSNVIYILLALFLITTTLPGLVKNVA